MTRREEIVTQAAREQSKLYESPDWRAGFVSGAMWADKTMLDKVCKWLKENVKVFQKDDLGDFILANLRKNMME